MQTGQRFDGRDDGRSVVGGGGSGLGHLRRKLRRWARLVLRLGWRRRVWRATSWGGRSLRRRLGTEVTQTGYTEGAELAGEAHRAGSATVLLLHAADVVLTGIENPCDTADLDCESPSARKECVAYIVLSARGARDSEVGRPPVVRRKQPHLGVRGRGWKYRGGGKQLKLHSASTRALSALSNMLPTARFRRVREWRTGPWCPHRRAAQPACPTPLLERAHGAARSRRSRWRLQG